VKTIFLSLFFVVSASIPLPAEAPPPVLSDHAAARLLDQATWGPTPESIAQLQQMGIQAWLAAQFAATPSDLPDQPILAANGMSNNNLAPVQTAFFQNAVSGPDQLRQRVAFALSEIWVVSAVSTKPAYAYPPYWRIFRDNAFGNYADIIRAVTLNPAMGNFLNMANNNKGNTAAGTAPNENYARELMQLFAIGLTRLNPNGTPVLVNNSPAPTYAQADVTNVSRMLTGWTYPTAPGATMRSNNPAYYFGPMIAVAANHDTTAKTVLGVQVPAGQSAQGDLDSLITILMAQPSIAPFICQQLIEHLVTSNPSSDYISRVSMVFLDNGSGVRGDMKAVITAILTDPEARAADDPSFPLNPASGHMREPILFMTNILRGLNASLTSSAVPQNAANNLGQNLFNAPSVFSYFSPQARTGGILAPEFQIYSTQTATNRVDTIYNAVYATLDSGTKLDLTPFVQKATGAASLIDYISYAFFHHSMSTALQSAITSALKPDTTPLSMVQSALFVALASSEYQIIQ
jgi:uncharacterized protein (DUF1800 family)